MRYRQADDEIWRGHSRYLGPPGFTLPFSVPYRSVLPGLAAGIGSLVLLTLAGLGAWRFLLAAVIAFAAGALADRYGGSDRPVTALAAIFSHESGAPRPAAQAPVSAVLRPGAVPVHGTPGHENGGRP